MGKFNLKFIFQNAVEHLHVYNPIMFVNDKQLSCEQADSSILAVRTEAVVGSDSLCKFEASFTFDPDYAAISYSWPVPLTFIPKGIFVYASKRFSWWIVL